MSVQSDIFLDVNPDVISDAHSNVLLYVLPAVSLDEANYISGKAFQ